jgi:UDP-3-O-[3-hydroxymyristoyl] glucosamine N-acyltransferase
LYEVYFSCFRYEWYVVEAWLRRFVDHPKYHEKALNSAATIALIKKVISSNVEKLSSLLSDDPSEISSIP